MAMFTYRMAVPLLRDTRSVASSAKPMRLGEFLEGASSPVRAVVLTALGAAVAAPWAALILVVALVIRTS